jgi:hypothetical protein
MVGIDCKSCGARGFRSLGALGSHRSLACQGKAMKRARHEVDEAARPAADEHGSSSNVREAKADDRDPGGADFEQLQPEPRQETQAAARGDEGHAFEHHDALSRPQAAFENAPSPDDAGPSSFNLDALPSQPANERLLKEVRTEHFDDERLLRFVRGCNNGVGLPESDQAAMLSMFSKGFDPKNLHIKSVQQLKKYEAESLQLEKDVSIGVRFK